MKKTISVNIGGRIFYIEEDAYSRLDTYLAEIKQHFSTFPDSDEVVADIETRISEHFESKQLGSETNIVSLAHVEELIGVMGNVQDFGDTEPTGEEAHQAQQSSKLFRDPDNAVLGGVASGIAAYFGWDPVWVRVVFVVSVFFGGYSILLYIILWIAMPEAETATDKLRMKGNPVTLSAIEQSVREQFADTTKVRSRAHKAGNAVRDLVTSIGGLLAKIFVIAGKIIAVIIAIGSVVGIAALTFILVMILVTGTSPEYIQFPLRDFLGTAQYLMALFAAFFIAVIPLAMLLQLCSRLLGQRKALNKTLLIGLAALWFVAATVVGAISVRNAPRYETFAAQHPLLKQMEQTIEVADFTRVSAEH